MFNYEQFCASVLLWRNGEEEILFEEFFEKTLLNFFLKKLSRKLSSKLFSPPKTAAIACSIRRNALGWAALQNVNKTILRAHPAGLLAESAGPERLCSSRTDCLPASTLGVKSRVTFLRSAEQKFVTVFLADGAHTLSCTALTRDFSPPHCFPPPRSPPTSSRGAMD